MKKIKLNKKRQLQLHFNYLFNKRSNYLKSLPNLNNEGIKEIENEKVDILIDKYLGINKFNRDYSFFNPPLYGSQPSFREESKKKKVKMFPELKVLITSPNERAEPNRYKQKDFMEDKFSNIYKTSNKNYQEKNNKLYGSYNSLNKNKNLFGEEKEKYFRRNENKVPSSVLTSIGKYVIRDCNDKGELDSPLRGKQLFNHITIK